jgi:hypothetical protein
MENLGSVLPAILPGNTSHRVGEDNRGRRITAKVMVELIIIRCSSRDAHGGG